MTEQHKRWRDAEVKSLLGQGMEQVSVGEFYARYDAAGFGFDKSCTIKQYSKYLSGPRAGESSPIAAMHPVLKGTSRSAFHNENDKSVYEAIKVLRDSIFAVSRDGYILEV